LTSLDAWNAEKTRKESLISGLIQSKESNSSVVLPLKGMVLSD